MDHSPSDMNDTGEIQVLKRIVTYTKDVHKKKKKKWMDGYLLVRLPSRLAELRDQDAENVIVSDVLPGDAPPVEYGGGDAFLFGASYLVLMDEVEGRDDEAGENHGWQQKKAMLVTGRHVMENDDECRGVFERGAEKSNEKKKGIFLQRGISKEQDDGLMGGRCGECVGPGKTGCDGVPVITVKRRRTTEELLDILGIVPISDSMPSEAMEEEFTTSGLTIKDTHNRPKVETSSLLGTSHIVHSAQKPCAESAWNIKAVCKPLKTTHKDTLANFPAGEAQKMKLAQSTRTGVAISLTKAPDLFTMPSDGQIKSPCRVVSIPSSFASSLHYLHIMQQSLAEEIGLRLIDQTWRPTLAAVKSAKSSAYSDVEAALISANVGYHGSCKLKGFSKVRPRGTKKHAGVIENDDKDGDKACRDKVFLTLHSIRNKSNSYHKNDIWIVSNAPNFGLCCGHKAGTVHSKIPWVALLRSLWHGPNQDGRFEVEFLSKKPSGFGKLSMDVYAIQGPEASIDLNLIDLLRSTHSCSCSMLSHLIQLKDASSPITHAEEDADQSLVRSEFSLNKHQSQVLGHIHSWNMRQNISPICLIHGPFGTGKSQLLISLLHFMLQVRTSAGKGLTGCRILVCSHTNIAVDRILMGLLESGINEFIRVGPLRRIHHKLLPYSIHASESKAQSSAISELRDMCKHATGSHLIHLQREIMQLEKGCERQRKKMLKTVPVVGVTCVSTALSILEDMKFDVLIIDEASQITEPLALAPIIRSGCKYLILAGDPAQLPPVVTEPSKVQGGYSISRPLFVRLTTMGHEPYLLKTQYRCHPDISSIANTFFYGNNLIDGISETDRSPLVPGLHAVSTIDVQGQISYFRRSIKNETEARCVCAVVKSLIDAGVGTRSMGVICLYRAQVETIDHCLAAAKTLEGAGDADALQVATVDSFQGAEKDVIILSVATNNPSEFATDIHRLNVALTRAKRHFILVGNMSSIGRNVEVFQHIIKVSEAKGSAYMGGLPIANAPIQEVHESPQS